MQRILALVFLAACGQPSSDVAPPSTNEATPLDPKGSKGSELCNAYLQCAAAALPHTLADVQADYGPDGTCWDGDPELCEQACEGMFEAAQAVSDAPECWPDQVERVFRQGTWTIAPTSACGSWYAENYDLGGVVLVETPTGFEMTESSFWYGDCDLDGAEFLCDFAIDGVFHDSKTGEIGWFEGGDCGDLRFEMEWLRSL